MSRILSLVASSSLALALAGCTAILGIEELSGTTDGGVPVDARPGDGALPGDPDSGLAGYSLRIHTNAPTLPLDGTTFLDIEIQRLSGHDREIRLDIDGPGGVISPGLTVSGTSTLVELPIGAGAPLAIGDEVSFRVRAIETDGAGIAVEREVTGAQVTGRPGLLDTSFGAAATGLARVSFGNDDSGRFYDLEILPDGSILAAGWGAGGLGAVTSALARLTADGLADLGFSGDGLVRTNFETGSSAESFQTYAIGRQLDGRIIAIGQHSSTSSYPRAFALARYTASGGEGDPLFGNFASGRSRILINNTAIDLVRDGLVTVDNRILGAGSFGGSLSVFRATSSGDLDQIFADRGVFQLDADGSSRAEAISRDAQGRLLVVGTRERGAQSDMIVVRLDENGALDDGFAAGGVLIAGSPEIDERAVAVAVRADGRLVVAGDVTLADGSRALQVRQFTAEGDFDSEFGTNGVSTQVLDDRGVEVTDMLLAPDGRILVLGNGTGNADPVLVRLSRDGGLDPYFDGDGVLSMYVGDCGAVETLALVGRSRLLIAGGDECGTPGPGTAGIILRLWI
ncbi:delta-60 repeat domain-containing protein [Haliangium ochraceum]|uniref:Delta-60 repeat protein n=1 Tax=Haliangium ochraceum (strain DSM 14365 / JCM 11303 / SMP-2) TaxID=502025 RepID=D0LVE9_HALO1|nr:delta-60 repeat domain-containing protein [Haliangium ochraceum]ACY17510.1 conserved hypothetical protein [Haliangium ochraceum DSM 14365]